MILVSLFLCQFFDVLPKLQDIIADDLTSGSFHFKNYQAEKEVIGMTTFFVGCGLFIPTILLTYPRVNA